MDDGASGGEASGGREEREGSGEREDLRWTSDSVSLPSLSYTHAARKRARDSRLDEDLHLE